MRKLASIALIENLKPIEDADRIELAIVRGWQCVVQKGLYTVGDKCVFHEIDALCPDVEPYASDLAKLGITKSEQDDGTIAQGYRIKTIRLKKQISQGYCCPLFAYPESTEQILNTLEVGSDLTSFLNIAKYEFPFDGSTGTTGSNIGRARGNFPYFIPKTDQERIQNCLKEVWEEYLKNDKYFQVSYKIDGSSITIFNTEFDSGICSRKMNIKLEENNSNFVSLGLPILAKIKEAKLHVAFQGEMFGPTIQQNFENVAELQVAIYNVYDIVNHCYLSPQVTYQICKDLDIQHVPCAEQLITLQQLFPNLETKEELLEAMLTYAEGPSGYNGKYREGFVFKSACNTLSFKVISNSYLLKAK